MKTYKKFYPKKWFRTMIASLLIICIIFSLTGCSAATKEPLSTTALLFDTVISIEIYDAKDESILEDCISLCKEYENKFSRTIETSEISQINNANGTPVEVSEDTIELIQKGIEYGKLSNGYFDITIAPLSTLWDFKNNEGIVPDEAAIAKAKSHVNYQNIVIEGNTVTLTDPKAAIDLGGIAKGYIADQLKLLLKNEGVQHGIISLGGNVLTIGGKTDGSSYTIGIQKPFEEGTAITSVEVKDKSVVSSGVYERYFKVDDKLYHHILNPATGYPFENNLLGVTIISEQSVDGDALSTTCFALGLEEGSKLIESLDGVEAIFITDDYKIHSTDD